MRTGLPAGLTTLVAGLLLLAGAVAVAISVGAGGIPMDDVVSALFAYDVDDVNQYIIHDVRLPRILAGAAVGACLAVAGAVMQALTRNPLADPGLLGLEAGAIFVLTVALVVSPALPFTTAIVVSFAGAGAGAALIYAISALAPGGMTPVKITLAGAAVAYMLTSLATGISLYYGRSQDVLYYIAGGMGGVQWEQVRLIAPWVAGGLVLVLMLSRGLTVLLLGEETAVGLGQRVVLVKGLATLAVVMLAGGAVAVAGPVGFVGLMIPHIVRYFVGVDYRWVIPCSAVCGAVLIVVADIGARMAAAPLETPVGFITALIGVPFLLFLARRDRWKVW